MGKGGYEGEGYIQWAKWLPDDTPNQSKDHQQEGHANILSDVSSAAILSNTNTRLRLRQRESMSISYVQTCHVGCVLRRKPENLKT